MTWPQPFTRQQTIPAAGIDTYVAECGDGAPIVFLHGNPDTHSVWATTIGGLPGVRCIAPDIPGFGKTAAQQDLSLESQGEWVAGLCDALKLDRIHLVVHDVGGVYGLAFATLHPKRLRALTIMNTIFFPDYKWHFWGRVWRTSRLGELAMKLSAKFLFISQLRRGSPTMPRDYAELAFEEFTPTTKENVLRYYRASTPDIWQGWDKRLLASIKDVPTQVLWGDKDPFIGAQFAERFGVTAQHVPHGHWLMTEDPEWCASKIAALQTRSAASP
ncbi:MAG: alpha/beta hydrolase [Kofleriaceae bacterium]